MYNNHDCEYVIPNTHSMPSPIRTNCLKDIRSHRPMGFINENSLPSGSSSSNFSLSTLLECTII